MMSPRSATQLRRLVGAAIPLVIAIFCALIEGLPNWFTFLGLKRETVIEGVSGLWLVGLLPWWAYAVTAFIFGGYLFTLLHSRRSWIAKPERLQIADNDVVGRQEDAARLLIRLRLEQLIFVVGEGGAGKSWLLDKVIEPQLGAGHEFLPISIRNWGQNWIAGPAREVRAAMRRSVVAAGCDESLLAESSTPGASLVETMRLAAALTGRMPVLIFDQFDDYAVKHRAQFARDGSFLKPAELSKRNKFWRAIKDLLRAGDVKCVIIANADTLALQSVSFLTPSVYHLAGLKPEFARGLLETLTAAEGVIVHPNKGFAQLKDRLISDLDVGGEVLPIRMKVAFNGLCALPDLSVSNYRAQGGLVGLEAAHIGFHVAGAARASGLSRRSVLNIVIALVDRRNGRSTPRAAIDLLPAVAAQQRSHIPINVALAHLHNVDIVRRPGSVELDEDVWVLDHDYLSRGILRLEAEEHRWTVLLRDRAEAWTRASGFRERRKMLLTPWEQLRLAWERLRGRVRFAPYRRYFLFSLQRWASPWLLIVVFIGLGVHNGQRYAEAAEAFWIFSHVGINGGPIFTREEREVVWVLRTAKPAIRRAAIYVGLSSPDALARFSARSRYVIASTMGLDQQFRDDMAAAIRELCFPHPAGSREAYRICAELVVEYLRGTSEGAQFFLEMSPEWPEIELYSLVKGIEAMGVKPPPELANPAFSWLLEAVRRTKDASNRAMLVHAAFHIAAPDNAAAMGELRSALVNAASRADKWFGGRIAEAVEHVGLDVSAASMEPLVQRIGDWLGRDNPLQALTSESTGLKRFEAPNVEHTLAFWRALPSKPRDRVARHVMALLTKRGHDGSDRPLSPILSVLHGMAPHLDGLLASELQKCLVREAKRIRNAWKAASSRFVRNGSITMAKDDENQVVSVITRIRHPLDTEDGKTMTHALGSVLLSGSTRASLITKLASSGIAIDVRALSHPTRTTTNVPDVIKYAHNAWAVRTQLSAEERVQIIEELSSALERAPDADLDDFRYVLQVWGPHLTSAEADRIARHLMTRDVNDSPSRLHYYSLAPLTTAVSARLSDTVAVSTFDRITKLLKNEAGGCETLVPLLRRATVHALFDVLKWPICSAEDREAIMRSIMRLHGELFELSGSSVDIQRFLRWAELRGFDVHSPPTMPVFDGHRIAR